MAALLADRDAEVRALTDQLAIKQQIVETLQALLSERHRNPYSPEAQLAAIRNSRSYRLMVELRRLLKPLNVVARARNRILGAVALAAEGWRRVLPRPERAGDASDIVPSAHGVRAALNRDFPSTLAVGQANHLALIGWCYHRDHAIARLQVIQNGEPLAVKVQRFVRPDVYNSCARRDDPHGYSLFSGFFATVPLAAVPEPKPACFALRVYLANGAAEDVSFGTIMLLPALPADRDAAAVALPQSSGQPRVVICMTTYKPTLELFRRQVRSIQAQSHRHWTCIITDDCSPPEVFDEIVRAVGDDTRFRVFRNPVRLGFYHNFERCLSLVPAGADFVALSDHDDYWHPDKLETLLAQFPDEETVLAYSDMNLTDAAGRIIANTYWTTRRNNYTNLASLTIANTITGAASLFRARLLSTLLPFPDRFSDLYHDHWIACNALARGRIRYVDRPLYDYVQHAGQVIGHFAPGSAGWRQRLRSAIDWVRPRNLANNLRQFRTYSQSLYLYFYLPTRQMARLVLARCSADLTPAKRRALHRLVRAEHSPLDWLWLATRGAAYLGRRGVTLGNEYRLLSAFLWQRYMRWRLKALPRPRHQALSPAPETGSPAVIPIYNQIDLVKNKAAPLKLIGSTSVPRRVNLLIGMIDFAYVFGGYITVFHLARRLARQGARVRLVMVDPCDFQPGRWRDQFRAYPGLEDFLEHIELAYCFDRTVPIEVSPDDTFVATNWWTAHMAHQAGIQIGRPRFVYLSQEYEPGFYPQGSWAALAAQSYALSHDAVFSTELLRDYFRQNRLGVFAQGLEHGERHSIAFENAITAVNPVTVEDIAWRQPKKLLFYARPEEHNARNLFEMGMLALVQAVRAGYFTGDWEFHGIGTGGQAGHLELADDIFLQLLPRQGLEGYRQMLRSHDVGMSLMHSPHPSLVPIEMASAGMWTVTNTHANKTVERLHAISTNLLPVDATIEAIREGLGEAARRVEWVEERVRGSRVRWSTNWDTSFPPAFMRRLHEFLNAPADGSSRAA
jgi:glycosyltransferase involved in cell wall biosynthesis